MKYTFTLLSLLFAFQSFSQSLSQNLLLNYKFDGNMLDSSVNGRHGQAFGGVAYGADRHGVANTSAYFNGMTSYVNFPNLAALKPQFPMSFSFWVNYTSEDYHDQVVFNTSYEENHCTGVWFNSSLMNNGHAINAGNGDYSYSPDTRRTFLCTKEIATNAWHQIVVVANSLSDMKIYVDCIQAPGSYSGYGEELIYSATPGCIGRHDRDLSGPADYFQGYIDDFMYWDRALTSTEVSILCAESLFSVDEYAAQHTVKVYPNPTNGILNVESGLSGNKTIKIYDFLGHEVLSRSYESQIDISAMASGVYLLQLSNGEQSLTQKIIVK